MGPLWQRVPAEQLLMAEWDGVYIVYHRPSGKTHVLNSQALELLEHILCTPQTRESAARDLGERLGVDVDLRFEKYFDDLLVYLEELGLVVRQ